MKRKFSSKNIVRRILEGYSRERLSFINTENTEGCWGQGDMTWRRREAAFKRIQMGLGYVEWAMVGFLVVT